MPLRPGPPITTAAQSEGARMNIRDPRSGVRPPADAGTSLEAADIMGVLKALPHRYPFLMIDRVIGMSGDDRAIGIKNVTINEPQFLGHFPGQPVFPGLLMIEGMAQTAGVLCIHSLKVGGRPQSVFFLTIDKAKFRKPVLPGDTIEYH